MNRNLENHTNRPTYLPTMGNMAFTLLVAAVILLTHNVWAERLPTATSLPSVNATTITYQGRLTDTAGVPLTGTHDLSFAIYDAADGGTQVWGDEAHTAVPFTNGHFVVRLGSVSDEGIPAELWTDDRYLQITVNGQTLTPREPINAVPIAKLALTVPDQAIKSRHIQLDVGHAYANDPDSNRTVLTTQKQIIPGTIITLTPNTAQSYLVIATMEVVVNESSAIAQVFVDGLRHGVNSLTFESTMGLARGTVSQTYLVHLEPGTHVLDLRANLRGGTTDGYLNDLSTTLSYIAVSQ